MRSLMVLISSLRYLASGLATCDQYSTRLACCKVGLDPGPPRLFSLSFLGFSIITTYCTYILYLLTMTKATTNLVKTREDVPQKLRFFPNAGFAIRSNPPILMRWPWVLTELEGRFRKACSCCARWNEVASDPFPPPLRRGGQGGWGGSLGDRSRLFPPRERDAEGLR
jgi:hypothetical protein